MSERAKGMTPVQMAEHVLKDAPGYIVVERTRLTTAERARDEARAELARLRGPYMSMPDFAQRIRDLEGVAEDAIRRAATAHATGRAAGLREAAGVCSTVRKSKRMGGVINAVKECEAAILALLGPSARCSEKWGGAGSQCKHNAGHNGRHSWESEPHKVSGPSTDEEIEASDNLVIKENAAKKENK